jgi:formylglycine-generating enzyme required for sulfatase activity
VLKAATAWTVLVVAVVAVTGIYNLPATPAHVLAWILPAFAAIVTFPRLWPEIVHVLPADWQLSPKYQVAPYLKKLVFDTYRYMLGAKRPDRTGNPLFHEAFCDLSSYSVDGHLRSLSSWMAASKVGREAYGAVLLGDPGAGKSVSLRAIALCCAHSYFLRYYHLFSLSGTRDRDVVARIGRLHKLFARFFDDSWVFPTPPLFPLFVELPAYEPALKAFDEELPNALDDLLGELMKGMEGMTVPLFLVLLREGKVALLMDGMDELSSDALRAKAILFARALLRRFPNVPNLFLLSCRTGYFTGEVRETASPDFHVVTINHLTTEDKVEIVRRLIDAEWRLVQPGEQGLLADAKRRLDTSLALLRPVFGLLRNPVRQQIISSLAHEIVEHFPLRYTRFQPTANPLSLRRMTSVLLAENPKHLVVTINGTVRCELNFGPRREILFDYATILRQDLLEYVNRRPGFCRENGYQPEDLIRLYGELAFLTPQTPFTRDQISTHVQKHLKRHIKELSRQVDNFISPGIVDRFVTARGDEGFRFRDEETRSYVLAQYMISEHVAERLDLFIEQGRHEGVERGALAVAFADLQFGRLRDFVFETKHFGNPDVLYALVAGVLGRDRDRVLSETESDVLLKRSMRELEISKSNSTTVRLWSLIRHVFFSRQDCGDVVRHGAEELLARLQSSNGLLPVSRGPALMTLAELSNVAAANVSARTAMKVVEAHLDATDLLVRSCAFVAADYLDPRQLTRSQIQEVLTVRIAGGAYAMGGESPNNPRRAAQIDPFRLARFPFMRYRMTQLRKDTVACRPGEAFKPAVGITAAEAAEIAALEDARLPTAAEFEVAAAYSGCVSGTPRQHPWSDDFENEHEQVAFGEVDFRNLLGDKEDALPVGLKPALATPSGIFDLTSNVSQWTADRMSVGRDPVSMFFGQPSICAAPHHLMCTFYGLALDYPTSSVGFRLAWGN